MNLPRDSRDDGPSAAPGQPTAEQLAGPSGPTAARLPPRLATLPLTALGVAGSVAAVIEELGIATVGDLAAQGRDGIEVGEGVDAETVELLRSRLDDLVAGRVDPTLSIAGTLPAELEELVVRAGITRLERTVAVFRAAFATEGESEPADAVHQLGITDERARQVREHAEHLIAGLLQWFEPRSLRLAREAVARAGGTAPLLHVAWAVGLMMPPVDFDAGAWCRWLLGLAADPGARLSDDGETVTGPGPEIIRMRAGGAVTRM